MCLKRSRIFSCGWFTYFPELEACQLLHNCSNLDVNLCPNCLSGPANCQPPAPQCWVKGECQGNLILTKPLETQEECLDLCKTTEGCKWFTFVNQTEQFCILLHDCTSLDESASDCVSGEERCQSEEGNGKFLRVEDSYQLYHMAGHRGISNYSDGRALSGKGRAVFCLFCSDC